MADCRPAPMLANFDAIARPYRWLEYLSFGPMLERCRFSRLSDIAGRRRALVIGDGDGRFLARLMRENRELEAEAVDASAEMLRLLEGRVADAGGSSRLMTRCEDARCLSPSGHYDCVATHFFLDCLTTEEVIALAGRIRPCLLPGAVWVVSDFAVPCGVVALPARLVVSLLYAAFGLLTALAVRRLPRHGEALRATGFLLSGRKTWLGGLLFSESWRLQATDDAPAISHGKMSTDLISSAPDGGLPLNRHFCGASAGTGPGIGPGIDPGSIPSPDPDPLPDPEPDPEPSLPPGPLPVPDPVTY